MDYFFLPSFLSRCKAGRPTAAVFEFDIKGDGTQGAVVEGDYSQGSHNSLLDLGWEMGES